MNRRTLLAAAAAASTTGFAACLDDGIGEQSGSSPTDGQGSSPTDTPDRPYVADQSFEVTSVECGSGFVGHGVTVEDGVVTVEGTLDGSNGCYTADLVTAAYDAKTDELYVEVESIEERGDGEDCTTCTVEIDYVARFTFENGEPSSVRVDQHGISSGSA